MLVAEEKGRDNFVDSKPFESGISHFPRIFTLHFTVRKNNLTMQNIRIFISPESERLSILFEPTKLSRSFSSATSMDYIHVF